MYSGKKSRWVLIFTIMAGTLFLYGCASTATEPPAAEPVTIVHWEHHSEGRVPIMEELVAEFEEANPNIKVSYEPLPYGAFFEKLGPSLEAGSGPDVFKIPANTNIEYYKRDQLAPIPETLMTTAEIEEAFVPWTLDMLKHEGLYYGLPSDKQVQVLFKNNELFLDAGLDPAEELETWEDLREAAMKLSKFEGDRMVQAGWAFTHEPWNVVWSFTCQLFDEGLVKPDFTVTYDSPEGIEMWRWITDTVLVDRVDDPEFLAEEEKFYTGKVGMNLMGYNNISNMNVLAPDMEYTVQLQPSPEGRPPSSWGLGWGLVVSAQSEHPEEAWKWLQFITSDEAQRKFFEAGGEIATRWSVLQDPEYASDPVKAIVIEAISNAAVYDHLGWDDVWYIFQNAWDEIVLNGADVETTVKKAAEEENALYVEKGYVEP